MEQKELLTKKDVASIGEEISHELAIDFVRSYQNANPDSITAYTIGRNVIDSILAQPGCVGLRFYNAINELGQTTLVYVGVDAKGNDITKSVIVDGAGKIAEQNAIVADRVQPTTRPDPLNPHWLLPY